MSDHIREQLSEFVDDEMPIEECDFFVRRLQLDDEARARFVRYQLIGSALRGEPSPVRSPAGAGTASPSSPKLLRFGVAASVLLAAVIGLVSGDTALLNSESADESPLVGMQAGSTGMQLLIHHAGYSSGPNRTLIPTTLFPDSESDDDVAVGEEPIE
jgi:negative regulator of sigma E activity